MFSLQNNKIWLLFFCVSFISLNISFISFGSYSLTGAILFLFYFLITSKFKISYNELTFLFSTLFFLIFNAFVNFSNINFEEFFASFFQTIFFYFFVILSFCVIYFDREKKSNAIYFLSILILTFQFFQLFELFIFGGTSSWFYLDSISTSTTKAEDGADRFAAAHILGLIRPISFYYEPSYLGFCLLFLFIVGDAYKLPKKITLFLIFGIFFTLSITILFFLSLFLLYKLKKNMVLLFFILFFSFFIIFYNFSILRLDEIFIEGSSGWERISRPMMYSLSNINNSISGMPLGQSDFVFNNSLFLMFLYFGPFTFIFMTWFFFIVYKRIDNQYLFHYFIILLALLFLNGAIFTIEGTFFVVSLNILLSKRCVL